jgi:hypothetical protein
MIYHILQSLIIMEYDKQHVLKKLCKIEISVTNVINFKDETCLFYIRTQYIPRSKHFPPWLHKTNLLMLCKAKVAVCSEIHTEPINTM